MQIILIAGEGNILTDGDTVYASTIRLAESAKAEDFHEITLAEYEEIKKAQLAEAATKEDV